MYKYQYLIVGGGMTGDSAVRGIREVDDTGAVGVIGAELHFPYDRPPLSKSLWKDAPVDSIWRRREKSGVTFHLGRTACALDTYRKQVIDDHGDIYSFDKLLLATGCRPRRLPIQDEHIIYFRTLDDYTDLRIITDNRRRLAIIGSGFIGAEVAAALAAIGKEVVMIFRGTGIGNQLFPPDLSLFLNEYYEHKGVELLPHTVVKATGRRGDKMQLVVSDTKTDSVRELEVDGVVAGIGTVPNVELAQSAGLEVSDGIRVSSGLVTSDSSIYSAGDVASFYHEVLGKWLRVEHEENANVMGRLAGNAMAGKAVTYQQLPFFYSDLFDLGYEAVGDVRRSLGTIAEWKQPYRKGVVYYLKDRHLRGVLLWNVFGKVDAGRNLIKEAGPFQPSDLKGRIKN